MAVLALLSSTCAASARADVPFRETLAPTGSTSDSARDLVITIHGGTWTHVGEAAAAQMHPADQRIRGRGYRVVNTSYRAGPAGLLDVIATYDWAHRRYPSARICAEGNSAGGHWALMLAISRPQLSCVISLSGPTDLAALKGTPESDWLGTMANWIFGTSIRAFSPVDHASELHTPALLVHPVTDRYVPPSQGYALSSKTDEARVLVLGGGVEPWFHDNGVSARALTRLARAERQLLRASLPRHG